MPLVIAMTALTLLTALGTVLVLGTIAETAIAASYREATEAFYAADAAVEFVVRDLAAASDWELMLSDHGTSTFIDGPPSGVRDVGAATLDLMQATEDVNASAPAGPGGITPSYALYAYGRFADLVPAAARSRIYVAVWIADVSDEAVAILGQAYGPTGSRRSVAVSVARTPTSDEMPPTPVRVLSWHEIR